MARTLLGAFASAVILVVLYYVLPMDNLSDAGSVAFLAIGMIGIAILLWWEVRAIVTARYPAIKAIQALAMTVPLFLLLFATTYYLLERSLPSSFNQRMSRTDALYFTVTTFSTVGYGDITARSQNARLIVVFQMLADLAVLGFGIKVVVGAVETGRQRQGRGTGDRTPSSPAAAVAGASQGEQGNQHDRVDP